MTASDPWQPTDDDLTAYMDGEAAPDLVDRIDALLESDRVLGERLSRLAAADRQIRTAFHVPADDPAVGRLAARLRESGTRKKVQAPRVGRWFQGGWPTAMAASFALVVAFVGGYAIGPIAQLSPSLSVGAVHLGSPVHELLESRPTGGRLEFADTNQKITVELAATFRDRNGAPCREFEATRGTRANVLKVGVACRTSAEHGWRIVGLFETSAPPADQGASGITPSSSNVQDVIGGLLAALGASQTLTPEEEAKLLAAKWK
jgi:hypothetical protein